MQTTSRLTATNTFLFALQSKIVMFHWLIHFLSWNEPLKLPACAKSQDAHSIGVCETRHITLRLRQHKFFAPTQRVTRPPTKGSELPSWRPDLPPSICQNTEAGGGGERKVTPRRKNKTASRFFSHNHLSSVGGKSKSQMEVFFVAGFVTNYWRQ